MSKTHYDVIRQVSNEAEEWNFNQRFLRALLYPKPEYEEKSAFYYALGGKPKKTGKYFCLDCDRYLTDEACKNFKDILKDALHREIIHPYMERHCPDCEEKLEDTSIVHKIEPLEEAKMNLDPSSDEIHQTGCEEKKRYEPCGCLFEIGEEKILWDINKEKAEEEVSLLRYDGPIFN